MTQIQDIFEGCREALAPLKLNEVFISRADSTLNTDRSRAVADNVSSQSLCCLFSLTIGPIKNQRTAFSMLLFHGSLSSSLSSLLLCRIPVPSPTQTPLLLFPCSLSFQEHKQTKYCGSVLDLEACS